MDAAVQEGAGNCATIFALASPDSPTPAASSAAAIQNIVPFIGHLLIKPGLDKNLLIPDKPARPGIWITE
jgi:hypothetical protein